MAPLFVVLNCERVTMEKKPSIVVVMLDSIDDFRSRHALLLPLLRMVFYGIIQCGIYPAHTLCQTTLALYAEFFRCRRFIIDFAKLNRSVLSRRPIHSGSACLTLATYFQGVEIVCLFERSGYSGQCIDQFMAKNLSISLCRVNAGGDLRRINVRDRRQRILIYIHTAQHVLGNYHFNHGGLWRYCARQRIWAVRCLRHDCGSNRNLRRRGSKSHATGQPA